MNLQPMIAQANALRQRGRLAEAEQSCREILQQAPQAHAARHLLSLILAGQGRADEALRAIDAALQETDDLNPLLMIRAALLQTQERWPDAVAVYDQILAGDPRSAPAWRHRGAVLRKLERLEEALASYDRGLEADPRDAAAWRDRGAILRKLERPDEALASYDQGLSLDAYDLVALNNRGNLNRALGRFEEALVDYNACVAWRPRDIQVLVNRAHLLLDDLARREEALRDFEAALAARPGHAEALRGSNLARSRIGLALLQEGRAEEALATFAALLAREPGDIEALSNRGVALRQLKRYGDALASFDAALAADPGHVATLNNRGVTFMEMNSLDEALAAFNSGLELAPGHAELLYNRGNILSRLKRTVEAAADYQAVLEADWSHRFAFGALAGSALALCDWPRVRNISAELGPRIREMNNVVSPINLLGYSDDPALLLDGARQALAERVAHVPAPLWQGPAPARDKIRVAYISADFRSHVVSAQLVALIEHHDRSRFEIVGIALDEHDGSDLRTRLEAGFDEFHSVARMSDLEAARLLKTLRIDIAVDLNGHTEGGRLGTLAHRPCPVQVTWLGYPGTTGADFIDYVIADPQAAPFTHQPWFSEQIVQLPLTYMPNDSGRPLPTKAPSRAALGLPQKGFVFCGFNNNWKITERLFDVWVRLLQQVPGSVLWLRRDNETAGENLTKEAVARGINPARLVFGGFADTGEDNVARLQRGDLFLDTLPYNAHATACDALWAGLPVVTCRGNAFAGRVAAGILNAAGLEELVADSLEDYEALALALARDPKRLKALKKKLVEGRATSALFDTKQFCGGIEAAYARMIEIARAGENPRGFAVPAS